MALEIELKLALSPKTARALLQHPLLVAHAPIRQRLVSTYYDTPELALHARHIGVRFRKKGWQWLQTVKSAEPASGGLAMRSEWECQATPGQFNFAQVGQSELRAELEALTPQLTPIFTTDFQRIAWTVPFGDSEIEIALDRGHIVAGEQQQALCEVELELLSGRVNDIFRLSRQLQEQHRLHPATASKAERGYRLFTQATPQPFKMRLPVLNGDDTPVAAFRQIALSCLEHLQRNEVGAQLGAHPEYVHQARVALRRLRSATRLFAPVLPGKFVSAYSKAWKALAAALGEARNWDVFVGETLPPVLAAFPNDRDVRRLAKEGQRRAAKAYRAIGSVLELSDYSRLLVEFTGALLALPDPGGQTIRHFAHKQLDRLSRKAQALAARHQTLTTDERHAMRIRFKKLRYAVEFFGPLLPARRVTPYVAALTQLQDELGMINDHVTAETMIGKALANRPAGPVHGWIAGRHALLVSTLAEALDTWLAQRPPWK